MDVFINLPVANVSRSRAFFATLGFSFDDRFADATAFAMTLSDHATVMLMEKGRFAGFTPRRVADAAQTSEVLLTIRLDCREAVDAIVAKALTNGGRAVRDPEDHGFMYGHAFADLDGHIWEPFWMADGDGGDTND